jgi:dGTPase
MSERSDRFHADKHPDYRSPFQRDRDRILYSSAFRRLAEITQVVSADEGHVFHNRLTHSLEVAQFGRRITEKLIREQPKFAQVYALDPDITEAASLAHDLGHPPFGHVAEEELNDLVAERKILSGFEGNAQSFRILNKLALTSGDYVGLNLTRGTLNATLKYPWLRETGGKKQLKWGAYHTEQPEFQWVRQGIENQLKCCEAELMDWADDVTYAVHDTIDFYRAGLIPLDRLAPVNDESERKRFLDEVFERHASADLKLPFPRPDLEDAFLRLIQLFPIDHPYGDDDEDRARLRTFSSALIGSYASAIHLEAPKVNARTVAIESNKEKEVFMLKQMTWHYVILRPSLATQQYGERKIIRDLFEIFQTAAKKNRFTIFPPRVAQVLREYREDEESVRAIVDMISGMTERQAVSLHGRLTGASLGSVLDHI